VLRVIPELPPKSPIRVPEIGAADPLTVVFLKSTSETAVVPFKTRDTEVPV
jgi:hypothetical protein